MARALALLFGAGGALVLLTLALPHDGNTNDLAVAVPSLLALVVCAYLLLAQRRVRVTLVERILALGTLLISVCVIYGGSSASAYQLMYVWVALYAGYFFSARSAGVQLVLCGVAYTAALSVEKSTPVPSVHWVMALGTGAVAAVLMSSVSRRVRQQAADLRSVADVANATRDADFRQAICLSLRESAAADAVVMLEVLPDATGMTVIALAGTPAAAQGLNEKGARDVIERVYGQSTPEVIEVPGSGRLQGGCGGFAQPVLRDGRAVAVLVVSWERPRRQLADRVRTAALLFAAEASIGLERAERLSRERQHRAMDINDNIVQGLVLAKYALERGQSPTAARTIDRTLDRARGLMDDHLEAIAGASGGVKPGDLVRGEASAPTMTP